MFTVYYRLDHAKPKKTKVKNKGIVADTFMEWVGEMRRKNITSLEGSQDSAACPSGSRSMKLNCKKENVRIVTAVV